LNGVGGQRSAGDEGRRARHGAKPLDRFHFQSVAAKAAEGLRVFVMGGVFASERAS
jgi:hypothetical protein